MNMKKALLQIVGLALAVFLLAGCGSAPAAPVATPVPAAATGTITGRVHLMAPPMPAMTVYAVNQTTGAWASATTAASNAGEAPFSIVVEPGTYVIYGAGVGYSLDSLTLTPVTVTANQTVADIVVGPPSQFECGSMMGYPAAPDGSFAAIPGPSAECIATHTAPGAQLPKIAVDKPIRFAVGPMDVELNGAVISGERDRYKLDVLAGETLEVQITSLESNAVFTILDSNQVALPGTEEGKDATQWTAPITAGGSYSILVGPTRGNATYTLKVKVSGLP